MQVVACHVAEILIPPTLKISTLAGIPSPLSRSIFTRERSSFKRKMLVFCEKDRFHHLPRTQSIPNIRPTILRFLAIFSTFKFFARTCIHPPPLVLKFHAQFVNLTRTIMRVSRRGLGRWLMVPDSGVSIKERLSLGLVGLSDDEWWFPGVPSAISSQLHLLLEAARGCPRTQLSRVQVQGSTWLEVLCGMRVQPIV